MAHALVALGSNLGDRAALLAAAVQRLAATGSVRMVAASSTHATSPIGGPAGQGEFLNAAALLETSLSPEQLFAELHAIESQLGRTRGEHWGPRAIDLDLLLYDDLVIDTPQLKVPHPRMAFRRFALGPAAEVAGEMIHPQIGWTVAKLLENLESATAYLAIAGPAAKREKLAKNLVLAHSARLISDSASEVTTSPSPAHTAAIQFDRQVRLLEIASWPDRNRLTISDFWLGETQRKLDELGSWTTERARRISDAMPPKLLIMLEQAIPGAMRDQPALVIESSNQDLQQVEAHAAILAMQ